MKNSAHTAADAPRRIAIMGMVVALSVALGYALSMLPNVELVTLVLFVGGMLLGWRWGALAGAIAFVIYGLINPFGSSPLPLYLAQIAGGAAIGILGGIFARILSSALTAGWFVALVAALFGVFATICYQILISVGSYISFGSADTVWIFILGGIVFSAVHMATNATIFAIMIPAIMRMPKVRAALIDGDSCD